MYFSELRVSVEEVPWGVVEYTPGDWRQVSKFILTGTVAGFTSPSIAATVSPLGAALVSLHVRVGSEFRDVVLGFDQPEDYMRQDIYAGVTVGRTASRLAGSAFSLDGSTHHLTRNTAAGHLHGGRRGFGKVLWTPAVDRSRPGAHSVTFTYLSPDGEEGYPGDVMVSVTYRLVRTTGEVGYSDVALDIEFAAMAAAATPLSMTNHSYFNLCGHDKGIEAENYLMLTNVNSKLVLVDGKANGDTTPVPGDAVKRYHTIPAAMQKLGTDGQLDDIFTLKATNNSRMFEVAALKGVTKVDGVKHELVMSVRTTQPALVVYSANYVHDVAGKDGAVYRRHGSVALETSGYPNAANVSAFPSVILRPGDVYSQETTYAFTDLRLRE